MIENYVGMELGVRCIYEAGGAELWDSGGTGYKLKGGDAILCRADGVLREASELRGSGEWLGGEVEGWVDWVLQREHTW